jgi:hypothetical protein
VADCITGAALLTVGAEAIVVGIEDIVVGVDDIVVAGLAALAKVVAPVYVAGDAPVYGD